MGSSRSAGGAKRAGEPLLDEARVDFEEFEVRAFKDVAQFMDPNPSKIKRITNIYRLARNIAMQNADLRRLKDMNLLHRLLCWIVLCEQWPVRVGWILQIYEDKMQALWRKREELVLSQKREPSSLVQSLTQQLRENMEAAAAHGDYAEAARLQSALEPAEQLRQQMDAAAACADYREAARLQAELKTVEEALHAAAPSWDSPETAILEQRFCLEEMTLQDFYNKYVKKTTTRVWSATHAATTGVDDERAHAAKQLFPEKLAREYQQIFGLESDPEVFDVLLAKTADGDEYQIKLEDVGTLSRDQDDEWAKLVAYCINLSPAVTNLLGAMKSLPHLTEHRTGSSNELLEVTVDEPKAAEAVKESRAGAPLPPITPPPSASRPRSEATTLHVQPLFTYATLLPPAVPPPAQRPNPLPVMASPAQRSSARAEMGEGAHQDSRELTKTRGSSPQPHKLERSLTNQLLVSRSSSSLSVHDDKKGEDHIGSRVYAMSLAKLIFRGLQTPCIIGFYAGKGRGKSTMMHQLTVALKALQIEQILCEFCQNEYQQQRLADELRSLLQTEGEQIELMFQWLQKGAPVLPKSAFALDDDSRLCAGLDGEHDMFQEADAPQLDTSPVWLLGEMAARTLLQVIRKVISLVTVYWPKCCCPLPKDFFEEAKLLGLLMEAGEKLRDAQREHASGRLWPMLRSCRCSAEALSTDPDYHFVSWNAWLYSGNDNLWAGLIKALHEAVEERYGAPYTRAKREAMMISVACQVLAAAFLLACAIVLGSEWFPDLGSSDDLLLAAEERVFGAVGETLGVLTSAGASVGLTGSAVRKWMTTPLSDSSKIVEDVASGAINKRLGFMHIIQQELVKIGELLQEPDSGVPSFLDYLLPTQLLHGRLHEFLAWLFNVGQGFMRPCRLIICMPICGSNPRQSTRSATPTYVSLHRRQTLTTSTAASRTRWSRSLSRSSC